MGGARRRPQGGRGLRLPPGLSDDPLSWRWHGRRNGHLVDLQDPRGIPGPRDGDVLDRAEPEGFGYGRGAVQLYPLGSPARREFGFQLLSRQRGPVRYLLQDPEAHYSDLRRP